MAKKRRTRKDKKEAKHTFTLSWEKGVSERKKTGAVKGQSFGRHKGKTSGTRPLENAKGKAKAQYQQDIKKDILKSLALAGIILCLEVVLYFIWPS
jgi:hypothetical protein